MSSYVSQYYLIKCFLLFYLTVYTSDGRSNYIYLMQLCLNQMTAYLNLLHITNFHRIQWTWLGFKIVSCIFHTLDSPKIFYFHLNLVNYWSFNPLSLYNCKVHPLPGNYKLHFSVGSHLNFFRDSSLYTFMMCYTLPDGRLTKWLEC